MPERAQETAEAAVVAFALVIVYILRGHISVLLPACLTTTSVVLLWARSW